MKMNGRDHQRILDFYQEAYRTYGDRDARSVRWSNPADQITRFRALLGVADLSNQSVLDVGCGMGELYKFFLQEQIPVDYTGIDIVPEFITSAEKRFPDTRFAVKDIFEVNKQFDYVVASGALSFKVENNLNYYQDMIRQMYSVARKAVAFNMLDNRIHIDDDIYAAYSPIEIADFCATIADRVEVVVDYLPQDFAVYLYRPSE